MKHKLYALLLALSLLATPLSGLAENETGNGTGNVVDSQSDATDKEKVREEKRLLIEQKKEERGAAKEEAKSQIQAKREENAQQRFEKGKQKALTALDRRTNSLTEALNRVLNRKRIRQEEQAKIQTEINKVLANVSAAKERVQNAGDLETLRNEFQNAVRDTRVYAVVVPKVRAMAMTSAIYNGIDRVEKVFFKIEEAIKKNPEKAAEANKLLGEAKSLTDSAESKTDLAWGEFAKMVPAEDTSTAKKHLEAGKTYLKEARDLLKKSVEKLKQIRDLVKSQGEESTIEESR